MDQNLRRFRYFLKDSVRQTVDFSRTDQNRGVPPPPVQKPAPKNAKPVALPAPSTFGDSVSISLLDAMRSRCSRRRFTAVPLSLTELSFLLWATQGVRERHGDLATLRTVPSAGARHAFETYLYLRLVADLTPGIYRYLPLTHSLVHIASRPGLEAELVGACFGQTFAAAGAVTVIWATIPARMEWRYGIAAHRVIAMDVGHVCQNLYLACEGIGAGTCAIGAYAQEAMDRFLGIDGEEEFTIYLAAVGKKVAPKG